MSTSATTEKRRLLKRDWLLLAACISLLSIWRAFFGDASEPMWLSREGLDVLKGVPFVHADRWSWSPQPWDFVPTSPGWEILAGAFRDTMGSHGIIALTALSVGASLAALAWISVSLGASATATTASLMVTASLCSSLMSGRASLPAFVWMLFAVQLLWVSRHLLARQAVAISMASTFACALGVGYVGIWMHNSWTAFAPLGSAAAVFLLFNADFGPRTRRLLLGLGGSTGLCLGVTLGPLGMEAFTNSARVAAATSGLITEWTSPWKLGGAWLGLWWLSGLLMLFVVTRELQHRLAGWPVRPSVVYTVIALGAMLAGSVALRFTLLGVIAASPVLARALSATPGLGIQRAFGERAHERYWRTVFSLLMVVALPLCLIAARMQSQLPDPAITALPTGCRLFSDDETAKYVEYFRRDIRVWIDGRHDYWGRERLELSNAYLAGQLTRTLPERTSCVLLSVNAYPRLTDRIDADPAWVRNVQTELYTLWVPGPR